MTHFLKIFISIFFITIASNVNSQWIRQYIDENVNLYDVRFINKNTGWICGGNLIYKTTNSGITWIRQPNPAQTGNLFQIHPLNERVVYACGQCTILKTEDGGDNWTAIRVGNPPCGSYLPNLYGLWFKDENKGWFCGNVQAMRTTNGGATLIDSMRIELYATDIHFRDDTTGIIIGEGTTYRTTNSGMNWSLVPLPFTFAHPDCWRASYIGNIGWTASRGNVVFRTTNYGVTWDSLTNVSLGGSIYGIEFTNELTGYAGAHGALIYKTTSGGLNWFLQQTPSGTPTAYLSVFALNDSIVWAVGGNGKIIYTDNGGLVPINNINTNIPQETLLYQNYPNPFNPKTKIKFELKETNQVSIKIYNISGRLISQLLDDYKLPGSYEIEFNSQNLPSGIYFYTLEIDNKLFDSRRMLLIK